MILRFTDRLARKIKARPELLHPLNANPYADWSLHNVAAGRTNYLVISNTRALYTVVAPLDGATTLQTLEPRVFAHLESYLQGDGFVFFYRRLVDDNGDNTTYSKVLNPQSMALLEDLAEMVGHYISEDGMTPDEVALKVNEAPMSVLEHKTPRDTFQTMGF